MILNGIPFVDIEDWKLNTVYKGEYHKVIKQRAIFIII